jgi:D-glycero-D-manno-heptose 1,7-bisphosphate phosphatase
MSTNRALFLDRDGVINHDSGHTSDIENFKFISGIFDVCRAARKLKYLTIVVTNQSGIGRGYYSEKDFSILTKWMCNQFELEGAPITDVFYCPFHPVHGIGNYKTDSFDRKPNPGMLLKAAKLYNLNLRRSIMIGDKSTDIQAALNAGVGIRCAYQPDGTKIFAASTHQITDLQKVIDLLTII